MSLDSRYAAAAALVVAGHARTARLLHRNWGKTMAWVKDAFAGVGFVAFVASAFVLCDMIKQLIFGS